MATIKEYLQSIIEQAAALLQRAAHEEAAEQLLLFGDKLSQIDMELADIDEALTDAILEGKA